MGCQTLSDVQEGVCGNGVWEPVSGEDCDVLPEADAGATDAGDAGASQQKSGCIPAGSTNQCRYRCSRDINDEAPCPEGFLCGVDNVCRRPAYHCVTEPCTYALPELGSSQVVSAGAVVGLEVADVDGDQRDDVVSFAPPLLEIHYSDPADTGASFLVAEKVGAPSALPSVGNFNGGKGLAFLANGGVGTAASDSDRLLIANSYATVTLTDRNGPMGAQPVKVNALYFVPQGTQFPSPAATWHLPEAQRIYAVVPPDPYAFALNAAPGDVLNGLITGILPSQRRCEFVAVAMADDETAVVPKAGEVRIYDPCQGNGVGANMPVSVITLPPINDGMGLQTPGICSPTKAATDPWSCRAAVPRLFQLDLNGDGFLDLIIAGHLQKNVKDRSVLFVAYGNGQGKFFGLSNLMLPDTASYLQVTTADDKLTEVARIMPPLAVGDVNNDGRIDFINTFGLFFSNAQDGLYYSTIGFEAPNSWTSAAMVDMNHDGNLDYFAGSSSSQGITFFLGTGTGLFNPLKLATQGPVRAFAIGDFDGDFFADLAFAEIGDVIDTTLSDFTDDTIAISFGALSGGPSQPVPVTKMRGVTQLLPTIQPLLALDLISDMFAVGFDPQKGQTNVALIPGSSSRQVSAPFFLVPSGTSNASLGTRTAAAELTANVPDGKTSRDDIVVYTSQPASTCFNGQGECASRLWLLPVTDDAAIQASINLYTTFNPADPTDKPSVGDDSLTPKEVKLGCPFAVKDSALLAVLKDDLFNVSPDTMSVAIAAPCSATCMSQIDGDVCKSADPNKSAVAIAKVNSGALQVVAAHEILDFKLPERPLEVLGKIIAADMDGDGREDVVLVSPPEPGPGGVPTPTAESRSARIRILFRGPNNELEQRLPDIDYCTLINSCFFFGGDEPPMGGVNGACPAIPPFGLDATKIRMPPAIGNFEDGFAKIVPETGGQHGRDALLAVLPQATILLWYDETFFGDVPIDQRFPALTCVFSNDGTQLGGNAVASGDLNGDGVQDVVLGGDKGFRVLFGAVAPPGRLNVEEGVPTAGEF